MDKLRRLHSEEKTGFRKWMSKKYYDRPDGQDIFGKLSYTVKMATAGGTACGIVYTAIPPPAMDSKTKLLRIARCLVPSIGMAVAFTCVTYYCTNMRKKDDPFNYLIGGAAAGIILGPATGMAAMGGFGAIFLGGIGYAKKSSQLNRTSLLPKIKQREFSSFIQKKWDTSLLEDTRRGNWIKEPPTN